MRVERLSVETLLCVSNVWLLPGIYGIQSRRCGMQGTKLTLYGNVAYVGVLTSILVLACGNEEGICSVTQRYSHCYNNVDTQRSEEKQ